MVRVAGGRIEGGSAMKVGEGGSVGRWGGKAGGGDLKGWAIRAGDDASKDVELVLTILLD